MTKSIFLEITKDCNMNCVFCSNIASELSRKKLTTNEILKLVDDLSKIDVTDIRLYGGEPFLYPDYLRIIEHIRSYDIDASIYTNCKTLDASIIKALKKYKVRKLLVSVDSFSAKTHDKIRGVKGAFDDTVANIKKLLDNDIKTGALITICRINKSDIKETYRFLYSIGITDIKANFISKVGRAKEKWNELSLTNKEMRMCVKDINEINLQLFGFLPIRKPCQAGIEEIYIDVYGNVFPCVLLSEKEYKAGNIRTSSIKDIIERPGGLFDNIRKTILDKQYCPKCKKRDVCGGGCRARAIVNHNRNLLAPDTPTCIFHHVL